MMRKRKGGRTGQGTHTGMLVYRHLRKEDRELRVIFSYKTSCRREQEGGGGRGGRVGEEGKNEKGKV